MFKFKKVIVFCIIAISIIFYKPTLYAKENDDDIANNFRKISNTTDEAKIYGYLNLTVLSTNNTPLSDITFYILDEEKNIVNVITTDEKGNAISKKLDYGMYYYVAKNAPINIEIDTKECAFKIAEPNHNIMKKVIYKVLENRLIISVVTETLAPAKNTSFDILDSNKNIIENITVNENGIAISKELKPGKYYYRESGTPYCFIKDEFEYFFIIGNDKSCNTKYVVKDYVKGMFKITCIDNDDKAVMGATFYILDNNKNILDTITTNEYGIAISKYLNCGSYFYQMINAPSNIIIDTTEYQFSISKNNEIVKKEIITHCTKQDV